MAHGALFLHALREQLVERGGAEAREGRVHVRLLLAPLALEGVHGEELGLGGGALAGEAALGLEEAGREVDVGGECRGEGRVGGAEGGVDGLRGVSEGVEEGWAGEDAGDVLFSVLFGRWLVAVFIIIIVSFCVVCVMLSLLAAMRLTTCLGPPAAAIDRPDQESQPLSSRMREEMEGEAEVVSRRRRRQRLRRRGPRPGTAAPLRRGRTAEAEARRRWACRCGWAPGCLVSGGGSGVLGRVSLVGSWTFWRCLFGCEEEGGEIWGIGEDRSEVEVEVRFKV